MSLWFSQHLVPPQPVGETAERDLPLEGLRGVSALMVMYTHIFAPFHWLDPDYAPSKRFWWFAAGPVAVLFFFVLSGYVIGMTVKTPATGPAIRGYLCRRLVRLVPINTAAVLLVWLLFPVIALRTIFGNLCFLQNSLPYFWGWTMPVIGNSTNLWSLNYEVVYYLVFLLIWRAAPRAGVLWGVTLGLGCVRLFIDSFPAFISSYACGALFWLAGLTVAWLVPRDRVYGNWPSALLLLLIVWPLELVNKLLPALLPAGVLSRMPGAPLNRLEILPLCVWLLLTVTGRGARWHGRLTLFCLGWASLALVRGAVMGDYDQDKGAVLVYAAVIALAWLLSCWTPKPIPLAKMAPVGLISFGLYVISLPLEFSLARQAYLPSGTVGSFILRVALLVGLSIGLAWLLERKLQPAIRLYVGRKWRL